MKPRVSLEAVSLFVRGRAISVAHLRLTPAAKERLLAFKRLDPETRTFKTTTQDSQEVSSGSVTMSSAGKSTKSASKFSITDLTNVKSSRKKTPASPSASIPKAPVRGDASVVWTVYKCNSTLYCYI
ncbi:hypothetical protein HanRHA438_Chr07g0312381 [Helianthus annuus]|nr:hypothetical protein HanRHA438_Chr07g0312381 [Helianthus annuus]